MITPEQIRALNAGAEADRLAAEYVMGWKWYYLDLLPISERLVRVLAPEGYAVPGWQPWTPDEGNFEIIDIPFEKLTDYSSDWNAMEQIVIQMRAKGWEWAIFSIEAGLFVVNFRSRKGEVSGEAVESGAPLATLKAALLALVAERGQVSE